MKIKNVKVYGLNESLYRSGLPMTIGEPICMSNNGEDIYAEPNNNVLNRSIKLAKVPSGLGHDNFLKGIIVQFDLQYPEYFSPQLQRYSWIDIVSSQSKMHKITSRELTKDDFTDVVIQSNIDLINTWIKMYNNEHHPDVTKPLFELIIQNLPSGYLKWMGISSNYLQLKTIWNQRCKHGHKLNEWKIFGEFIQSLPMAKELIISS